MLTSAETGEPVNTMSRDRAMGSVPGEAPTKGSNVSNGHTHFG